MAIIYLCVNFAFDVQINGDGEPLYYGNKPAPPPQPPAAPRTPRTPRGPTTPRGVPSTPRNGAVNGWDTPRQHKGSAGKKRLTSGSDSNPEYEEGYEVRKREGSAGKRRKNEHHVSLIT